MFMIKVKRVLIEDKNNIIKEEFIRGDKVIRIRPWHKGDKDKGVEGDMSLIVSRDPETGERQEMRVLENADFLSQRLNDESRIYNKGHHNRVKKD